MFIKKDEYFGFYHSSGNKITIKPISDFQTYTGSAQLACNQDHQE
jgi:hypothetical protein